jgi:hypothetical protein
LPTPLEELASRPDVEVLCEREIERFAHEDAVVTIAATAMQAPEPPAMRMQGVRVVLSDEFGSDEVYLDAKDTLKVLLDIVRLENEMSALGELQPDSVFGTGSYWCFRPRPVVHMLCPEIYRNTGSSGVLLRTMSVEDTAFGVRLPGLKLGTVATAMMKAWNYLLDFRASADCNSDGRKELAEASQR